MVKNLLIIWGVIFSLLFQNDIFAQRQMEKLDRGVVAVSVSGGVFISWRIFGNERTDISYNIYRNGVKLNSPPITGASNYFDDSGTVGNTYQVAAIVKGIEQEKSASIIVWGQNYIQVPLQIPAGGTTPIGEVYSYNANDCSVGDLDGDGQYEIVLKWEPSNAKDNSQSGYTGPVILDAYKLNGTRLWRINLGINIRAGAHYTQFMVYDLDGDGKAEMACKTADGTTDGLGAVIGSPTADYRNSSGYILSGPEFLTIFNGETGGAMTTVNYDPPRGIVSDWGDSNGNRVDRFLACIAYLDGSKPSLVMCRGYYTRAVLIAYDWRGGILTKRWTFDSNIGYPAYAGQGNHNISVADADNDGKDEIIYGACAIDHDGKGLWTTGLGHGDAMHVSDIDPDRPGLEKWGITESIATSGSQLLDTRTGAIIWGTLPGDVPRGVAGDITASYPGMECWGGTSGLRTAKGDYAGSYPESQNHLIYWDGDNTRELMDVNRITKYGAGTLLTADGCSSNNGSKNNPAITADIFGDWREEAVWRTSDNANLRIYTTTNITNRRMYTLMHDPHYRVSVAWQNVAYNQPPHLGFYFANDTEIPPTPFTNEKLVWEGDIANNTWDLTSTNWLKNGISKTFSNGDSVLFDFTGVNNIPVTINSDLQPSNVTVFSTSNYTFAGPGKLTGDMMLIKSGSGTLTLDTTHTYSGSTEVWDGALIINDTLENSTVIVRGGIWGGVKSEGKEGGRLEGKGSIKAGVTLLNKGCISPGNGIGSVDSITVGNALIEKGIALNCFDLTDDPTGLVKPNDKIIVKGDLSFSDSTYFIINKLDSALSPGDYRLIRYSGTFTGNVNKITVIGIPGIKYTIKNENNSIILNVEAMRSPSSIVWTGTIDNVWDLATTANWIKGEAPEIFVTGDTVTFIDNFTGNNSINISGVSPSPANIIINSNTDYAFGGTSGIIGASGINKTGEGKLSIPGSHNFTGPVSFAGGILEIGLIANGGVASSIGAGTTAASNLKFEDIVVKFTGATSSTDRSMILNSDTISFDILSGRTISMSGVIQGAGKLQKTGTGTLFLSGINTYSGGTIIKSGTVQLAEYSGAITPFGSGYVNVTLENATIAMSGASNDNGSWNQTYWNIFVPEGTNGTINADGRCEFFGSLAGAGNLNIYLPFTRTIFWGNWSAFNGKVNLTSDSDGGEFRLANSNGYSNAAFNLGNRVTAYYHEGNSSNPGTAQTVYIGELSGVTGSYLINENWVIGSKNTSSSFYGIISGNSLTKVGTGSLTLANANTYAGGTTINGGTLVVWNSTGSATGTGLVTVNNGCTLRGNSNSSISGPVTINSGATLTGLTTIGGAVTINNGGTLSPGSMFGTITVNNNLTMLSGSKLAIDVIAESGFCDKLSVSGTNKLKIDGILEITNQSTTAPVNGNSFTIFNCSNISGSFDSIVPAIPGPGLVWDTTLLRSNGIIRVDDPTNTRNITEMADMIKVYPNPSNGNVNFDLNRIAKNITIEIYNSLGVKIMRKNEKHTSHIKVDIAELPEDVYFVYIFIDGDVEIKKIVKQ